MTVIAPGDYVMKHVVMLKTQGSKFEPPKELRDPSFYQEGMGELAFDVVESQKAVLREQIEAGCVRN